MTGWMETAIGIGAALSPIGVAGVTIADTITGSGGADITPAPAGMAVVGGVEVQGPLNIVEIEGVPIETPGGSTVPHHFNQGTIGLVPYHLNNIDAINEIVKQGSPKYGESKDLERIPEDTKSGLHKFIEAFTPPSFAYEGPIGGAGPLGLFAPAPGSPEYEAFIKRKNEPAQDLNLDPNIQPAEKENKWTTNITKTLEDFSKGFYEGYHEEKGHGLSDLIPGLPNTSNLPLMLMVGGGILLLILIIK